VVAIIGPGPIGLLAVNSYKALGVKKIIVVGTRPERNELAMRLGATHAINPRQENAQQRLLELTEHMGPDIIFEAAGKPDAVLLALQAVRVGGAVALAGVAGKATTIELESDYFIFKGVRVFGVLGYTPKTFLQSLTMLELYGPDLQQLITHRLPLQQYQEAFRIVRQRQGEVMKAILLPH
jgi:threonine dehydrogenase-like Zn-dependent dehydrogenase